MVQSTDPVTAYARRLLTEWRSEGLTWRELGERIGVTHVALINVHKGRQCVGRTLEEGFARYLHGGSIDALRSVARAPKPPFEVLHTANDDAFTCASCDATQGAFVRYEQLGDHCERCALSCCGCGAPVEAKDTMMCAACRPAYEFGEAVDGSLGWFARPDAIRVEDKLVRVGRVTVRRDVLSRALQLADRADTELLIEHGWRAYGFKGWWRKGAMGPSSTKAAALSLVRAELRRAG